MLKAAGLRVVCSSAFLGHYNSYAMKVFYIQENVKGILDGESRTATTCFILNAASPATQLDPALGLKGLNPQALNPKPTNPKPSLHLHVVPRGGRCYFRRADRCTPAFCCKIWRALHFGVPKYSNLSSELEYALQSPICGPE